MMRRAWIAVWALCSLAACQGAPESASPEAPTEKERGRGQVEAPAPLETREHAHAVVDAEPRPAPGPAPEPEPAPEPAAEFPSFGDEAPYAIASLPTRHTRDIQGSGALMARFETSAGVIRCRLYEDQVPGLVDHFVGLARGRTPWRDPRTGERVTRPFYDGLIFHRVEPGFIIEGGDPTGTGMGGPGFTQAPEYSPTLRFNQPGVLAMTQRKPGGVGSQFFMTLAAAPQLDERYPILGLCADHDVIEQVASRADPGASHRIDDPVVIRRVTFARGGVVGP